MKGKVLSIITAVLFGATMMASPILYAAPTDTGAAGTEEQAPAKKAPKKKATKKKATKKKATEKKAAKKKSGKKKSSKKEAEPAAQPE
jgi:hypothetical protein